MAETKLIGQLYDHRLRGVLNTVPSSGSVLLQAKSAYPSHDEQVIMPDDEYQGLSLVKVMPVPRLPACVASVEMGMPDADVDIVVNLAIGSSITAEDYKEPATHAFYNGVRLPIIPEDVLAQYPYAWIRNNTTSGYYDLLLCPTQRYYNSEIYPADAKKWYRIEIASATSAEEWVFYEDNNNYFGIDDNRTVLWSNHDIPNGSADATDIYFAGSEPVLDE